MLAHFIKKAHKRAMGVRPRIVIGVPSEITQVGKRAVKDSAYRAKASEVYLVEEAMAAAIGAAGRAYDDDASAADDALLARTTAPFVAMVRERLPVTGPRPPGPPPHVPPPAPRTAPRARTRTAFSSSSSSTSWHWPAIGIPSSGASR